MATDGTPDRDELAREYVYLLKALAGELDRAMYAIARNDLTEFEDSVSTQVALSSRLDELVNALCSGLEPAAVSARKTILHGDFNQQIRSANDTLQRLNRRYAALLRHSSHSVEMMISLCRSFTGQLQEGSRTGSKQPTLSCRI